MVPSYSESFGLVAAEAQACGTPVIAASVGGLRTAVQDGVSGILVDGHDPASYARVLAGLFASPGLRARLAHGAVQHASRFGWGLTVDRLLTVYAGAMSASLAASPSYTRAG
jgi:D-inositol-3-phosphate glycosyltransferase